MLINFTAISDTIADKNAIIILEIKKYSRENLSFTIAFICIITDIPPNENKAVINGRSLNISFSSLLREVISIKEFAMTDIFSFTPISENKISTKAIITDEKIIIIQILKSDTADDSTDEIIVSEDIFILYSDLLSYWTFAKNPEITANRIVDTAIERYTIIPAFFDEYNTEEIPITKAGEGI